MDFLNSFFQNIKDKLTSPFFGTLSFILLVHHWEFWYTILNFDNDMRLSEKLAYMKTLSSVEFTVQRLLWDVSWAFGIMLIGYFIVISTRSLSLLIDHRAMPWITGHIISKNVVERRVHEDVIKERDKYSERYEEQRQLVRKYSQDYDEQVIELQNRNNLVTQLNEEVAKVNSQVSSLNADLSIREGVYNKLKAEFHEQLKIIEQMNTQAEDFQNRIKLLEADNSQYLDLFFAPENIEYYRSHYGFPPTLIELVNRLKKDDKWEVFNRVVQFERRGGTISVEYYPIMEAYGIVHPGSETLTSLGRILAYNFEKFNDI